MCDSDICLNREKSAYYHQSNVPPQTAVFLGGRGSKNNGPGKNRPNKSPMRVLIMIMIRMGTIWLIYVVGPLSLGRVCCKKLGAMFTQINLYSWGDFIDIQNEHVRLHVWNFPTQYWKYESERHSETRCMDIEAQCLPIKVIRNTSHYSTKYYICWLDGWSLWSGL